MKDATRDWVSVAPASPKRKRREKLQSTTSDENGSMADASTFRFRTWDLLALPAVLSILMTFGGSDSLRQAVPFVFAFWVAVRQREFQGIAVVNPLTVGIAAGIVSFVLVYLFGPIAEDPARNETLGRTAMFGALAGLGYGVAAVLYVGLARHMWAAMAPLYASGRGGTPERDEAEFAEDQGRE